MSHFVSLLASLFFFLHFFDLNLKTTNKYTDQLSDGKAMAGIYSAQFLLSAGCNEFAQLGIGNTKQQSYPTIVRGLSSKSMADVYCAQHFTISWTTEELFFWGGKPKSRQVHTLKDTNTRAHTKRHKHEDTHTSS